MMTEEMGMVKLVCKRCGYGWYPRKKEMPKTCPRCRSPYWTKERKTEESFECPVCKIFIRKPFYVENKSGIKIYHCPCGASIITLHGEVCTVASSSIQNQNKKKKEV